MICKINSYYSILHHFVIFIVVEIISHILNTIFLGLDLSTTQQSESIAPPTTNIDSLPSPPPKNNPWNIQTQGLAFAELRLSQNNFVRSTVTPGDGNCMAHALLGIDCLLFRN